MIFSRSTTACSALRSFVGSTPVRRRGTQVAELRRRGRQGTVARDGALRLCRELLSVSAAEIAVALDVAPSGWSMTVRRTHERMESDAEFAQAVVELSERLGRYTWEEVRFQNDAHLGRFTRTAGDTVMLCCQ